MQRIVALVVKAGVVLSTPQERLASLPFEAEHAGGIRAHDLDVDDYIEETS